MLIRRLATALVVLAPLTVPGCAVAGAVTSMVPDTLNGIYQTRVDSEFESGALNGVWRLRLDNGAYTFSYTGKASKNVIISGVYLGQRQTNYLQRSACGLRRKARLGGLPILRLPAAGDLHVHDEQETTDLRQGP